MKWLYLAWFWLSVRIVEWQAASLLWNLIGSFGAVDEPAADVNKYADA